MADNPMDAWAAFQKSWLDMMTGASKKAEAPGAGAPDPFAAWRQAMGVQEGAPPFVGGFAGLQHALASFGAYSRLYDAWLRTSRSKEGAAGATEQLFASWREIVEDFARRAAAMFSPGLTAALGPGGVDPKDLVERMLGWFDTLRKAHSELLAPWSETLGKLAQRAMDLAGREPSAEVVEEFHAAWLEAYEESVGRFARIPSVGPAREKHDLVVKCLDAMFLWQGATAEFALEMQIPARQAFEKVSGELAELVGKEPSPERFHAFYENLILEADKRMFELLKSERFARAIKATLSASLDLYKVSQQLMEEQLKGTPVVTRTEMDEVEAELVALRRRVEAQAKELERLKAERAKGRKP